MSYVNADISTLLDTAQKIQKTVDSIESTKHFITNKYQQLGSDWNDKKYKDLGDVINECNRSLNTVLKALLQGEKYVALLAKSLQEYEGTTLYHSSNQGQTADAAVEATRTVGSNGRHGFLANLFYRSINIRDALKGVKYNPIQPSAVQRTEQQIISSISGGDMTEGSCSSLALAYAGNRAGYVVFDFRDGQSRDAFSLRTSIEQIASLEGVDSVILRGKDDTICAQQLESHFEHGRQYYMATGSHAAIVRRNDAGHYQYLELQSDNPSENGWHSLTLEALYERFGCEDGQSREYASYLIELDSLQSSPEFLDLLGYINTDESAQMRGESGHVR